MAPKKHVKQASLAIVQLSGGNWEIMMRIISLLNYQKESISHDKFIAYLLYNKTKRKVMHNITRLLKKFSSFKRKESKRVG